MSDYPLCEDCRYYDLDSNEEPCKGCQEVFLSDVHSKDSWEKPGFQPRVLTNADHIRSMTDEELAEWVTTKGRTFGEEYEGYMSLLDWLKAPVEDVQDG